RLYSRIRARVAEAVAEFKKSHGSDAVLGEIDLGQVVVTNLGKDDMRNLAELQWAIHNELKADPELFGGKLMRIYSEFVLKGADGTVLNQSVMKKIEVGPDPIASLDTSEAGAEDSANFNEASDVTAQPSEAKEQSAPESVSSEPYGPVDGDVLIPGEEMLTRAYRVAGYDMDFILPAEVKDALGKELARHKGKKADDVIEGVSKWVRRETGKWIYDLKHEQLSLSESIRTKKGECTERTSFLYAALMHAKQKMPEELGEASFKFAYVTETWDGKSRKNEDHVCVSADTGDGKAKYFDVTYPQRYLFGESMRTLHKKASPVGHSDYAALLLTNKAVSLCTREVKNRKGEVISYAYRKDYPVDADKLASRAAEIAPGS
ncbi:MAG TPA: hypothetical protein PLY45_06560, partial [bacterium]|nr:hypothetical protein [bacterium]